MESEGRSPLRILRHARIMSKVFTSVLFSVYERLSARAANACRKFERR
jgi:hypothetical protein